MRSAQKYSLFDVVHAFSSQYRRCKCGIRKVVVIKYTSPFDIVVGKQIRNNAYIYYHILVCHQGARQLICFITRYHFFAIGDAIIRH